MYGRAGEKVAPSRFRCSQAIAVNRGKRDIHGSRDIHGLQLVKNIFHTGGRGKKRLIKPEIVLYSFVVLLMQVAEEVSKIGGLGKILVAENEVFNGFLPEAMTPLILEAQKQFNFTHILAGATAMAKVSSSVY